jgi:uncharacterized membrane protein
MHQEVSPKQLRSFGLLVGGVFAVIGLWPAVFRVAPLRLWALVTAGLLIGSALVVPQVLKFVYQFWMLLGHILGWINTRIILSLIFYAVFTPAGVLMRLFKKDPMRRKPEPGAESYRVVRQPRPGSHMKQQF